MAVGLVIGSAVFFYAYPGKPQIGVIEIPFTVIDDRSAFEIGAMLDYVRDDSSIKGVVISLNTPGGSAAPSEDLYFEMLRLQERKPVVLVMEDLVASGGFMMATRAHFPIAPPPSFLGGPGGALSPLPPRLPLPPTAHEGVPRPFQSGRASRRPYLPL
ncbi:MAG: hypothetical protein H8E48_12130, partial [Chloroflexi bacterium]|nr:hypothetical protein [Chloroflexota bacterium]